MTFYYIIEDVFVTEKLFSCMYNCYHSFAVFYYVPVTRNFLKVALREIMQCFPDYHKLQFI